MTIYQYFINKLVENGMFELGAKKVMQAVIADKANELMANHWMDDIEGYPDWYRPTCLNNHSLIDNENHFQ